MSLRGRWWGKSADTSRGRWVAGEKALERGQGEKSLMAEPDPPTRVPDSFRAPPRREELSLPVSGGCPSSSSATHRCCLPQEAPPCGGRAHPSLGVDPKGAPPNASPCPPGAGTNGGVGHLSPELLSELWFQGEQGLVGGSRGLEVDHQVPIISCCVAAPSQWVASSSCSCLFFPVCGQPGSLGSSPLGFSAV